MSDHNDLGGLEDLAKDRDHLAFCRAIQKLSPVGGPPCERPPGCCPPSCAKPIEVIDEPGRTTFNPAPRVRLSPFRAIEVRTKGQ
jgi:hypothetical protein